MYYHLPEDLGWEDCSTGISGQWHLNDVFAPTNAECDSCIRAGGPKHTGVPLGPNIWRYAFRGQWREMAVTSVEILCYRTLQNVTLRAGKDGSTTKLGEFRKGTVIEVTREATNFSKGKWEGLTVLFTTTRPTKPAKGVVAGMIVQETDDKGEVGGWVKLHTSKGQTLLERVDD